MSEIKEQDNLSQTEEQEKPKFRDAIKLFEDYRNSNYSKDYINELDEKSLMTTITPNVTRLANGLKRVEIAALWYD